MKLKAVEKLCKAESLILKLVETLGAVYNAAGVAAEQEKMRANV